MVDRVRSLVPESADPDPITIVLADDHTIRTIRLRGGPRQGPAVLVLDLNMPGGSSIEAIPRLKALSANMAVVVLTMEHDSALARAASRAGAGGFVLKDAAKGALARAIRQAVRDGT